MEKLIEQLKRHEGLRLKPYRCTAGKLTIGYGRNLEDRGITQGEAESMLWRDVAEVRDYLEDVFDAWWFSLDGVRQAVLVNMAFNLGGPGLLKFRKMIDAVSWGRWEDAAREMLDSRWAQQVGNRATELAKQMETGRW